MNVILREVRLWRLRRELAQRKKEEDHLKEGGCLRCWPLERVQRVFDFYDELFEDASLLVVALVHLEEKCPVRERTPARDIIANLPNARR